MFSYISSACRFHRCRETARRAAARPSAVAPGIGAALLLAALLVAAAPAAAQSLPSFSKSFTPSTIGPGAVSTLRFDIVNAGGGPVRNLAFVDNLPAGMTIANPPKASTTCSGAGITAAAGGSTITFANGGVGAGGSCSVQVDVTTATVGPNTNVSGDLTSDAGNSGSATAVLTVATDRPGFTKAFVPDTVAFAGRSTLVFTIDNSANPSGAINLTFTDSLPAGMVVASPASASTTCGGGTITAPAGGGSVSYGPAFFGDATVGANATCTVQVDVLGNAIGVLGNTTGELTSQPPPNGPLRSSGKASAVLTVISVQISLIKRFTDDPVPPGGTVTLQFTVINFNRESPATAITFTDDLDGVLTDLAAIGLPASDVCGSGSLLTGTGLLTLTGGNLPAEGSCTFSVTLQVPVTAASDTYTNTTSEISGDVAGRPTDGPPASDLLFVQAVPLLTKAYDGPVGAGGTVRLDFSITNTSPDQTATDIAFTDEFPEIVTSGTVEAGPICGGASATFLPASGSLPPRLTFSGGSLAAAGSCTFFIDLDVEVAAPGGVYPNTTSTVTATVGGQSVTGSPASDDLLVVGAPLLSKEFIDDPVAPGDTVTLRFTLTYSEAEVADATGVTFSDDLDAALSGLVAVGLPATDVCGIGSEIDGVMTLLFTGGTLSPGESCSFDVTLQVPTDAPIGAHTNVTSAVVSSGLGVTATGSSAADDLNIAGLSLTKEFIDDPVIAGGTVTLRFTIANQSADSDATAIFFFDNLNDVIPGMTANGLPQSDICGTGSSLTALSGGTLLQFSGGSVAAGDPPCVFDVVLTVPAGTEDGTYINVTSSFSATIDGQTVLLENAFDRLEVVSDFLTLDKEFVGDPVIPGDTVILRFTVTNLSSSESITGITFTDDLDAALTDLVAIGLPAADVCGTGSSIDGTGLLTLTGGSLGPDGECVFDVTLAVPADAPLGSVATNVTSEVSGTVDGFTVTGPPATDDLEIAFITFSKSFSGSVEAGDVVTLTFNIENLSETAGVSSLSFIDDLNAALPGLEAIGLPITDFCGEGSELSGTTSLVFSGGTLLPGGSCTFSVDLQVPEDAEAGDYLNVTSDLLSAGLPVADPATATLTVFEDVDSDDDGVLDGDDVCPGTVIPEGVPTRELKPNRYALVDEDFIFDTVVPPGGGPGETFTTTDTAGCSCEQIIEALGLGQGHVKFGCSLGAMRNWVDIVSEGGELGWKGRRR